MIDTDPKGVFLRSKYAIPVTLNQGGGIIISNSSTIGLGGKVNMTPCFVSKEGIILLTKTMAAEYAGQDIQVNCICPGIIETPMTESYIPRLQMQFIPL